MAVRGNLSSFGTFLFKNYGCNRLVFGNSWQKHCFSTKKGPAKAESHGSHPPLTQPLPGLPPIVYSSINGEENATEITTFKNGLRVASENTFGQFCTVGVVIDSGSRYEVSYPSGISHFLEKLAFNSTKEFRDKDKILHELEKHGGICDCQSARDTFIYAASANSRGLDAITKVLGEVVLRPQISVNEVESARQAIQFELETLLMRPEQELLLMDMVHAAAYKDNTLGLPKICPKGNIGKIDRSILFTYLQNHYTPKRMVVAGVGVNHRQLVDCVEKYFVQEKPIWEEDTGLTVATGDYPVDDSVAQYTGGMVQDVCTIPQYAGPSGLPELAHVVLALEGCSHQDDDFIPTCVLNMMMGGGGSFSAGGPGKGMYTRLYTNVLNRYHWMYSATAYNHAYYDTGLFAIHASAPPARVRDLVDVLVREMAGMAGKTGNTELQRAKKQLQSMLLMNLEARPVVFEDIGRQVLATGQRRKPEHFIRMIEEVVPSDIERVAANLLRSQPAVAARGEVQKVPRVRDIQNGLQDPEGRLPSRLGHHLSLFR